MFCKNCGAKLDENAKFCMSCGNAVVSNEANQPEYILVTTNVPGQKRFITTKRSSEQFFAL